jgi:hypothetical protein
MDINEVTKRILSDNFALEKATTALTMHRTGQA